MGDKHNRSSSKSLNQSFDVFEDDSQERPSHVLDDSFDVFEASFSHPPLDNTEQTNDLQETLNRSHSSNSSRFTQNTIRPVSTSSHITPNDSFDETMVFTINSDGSSDTELDTTFATENTSGTISPPTCNTPTILTSTPIPPEVGATPRAQRTALRSTSKLSGILSSTPIPPDDNPNCLSRSDELPSARRSPKISPPVKKTCVVVTSTQITAPSQLNQNTLLYHSDNVSHRMSRNSRSSLTTSEVEQDTHNSSFSQIVSYRHEAVNSLDVTLPGPSRSSSVTPEVEANVHNSSFSQIVSFRNEVVNPLDMPSPGPSRSSSASEMEANAHNSSFSQIGSFHEEATNSFRINSPRPSRSSSVVVPVDSKALNELRKPHEDFRKKRDQIAAIMNSEDPEIGVGERYGSYMHLKKTKLQYQVNVLAKPKSTVSSLFEGISIFVNGHTDPSALELRELIQAHGGEYHCYLEYGRTTYTIASSLAAAKVNKARVNEIFLLPSWIVDCISAGSKLPIHKYILHSGSIEKASSSKAITNFLQRPGSSLSDTSTKNSYEEPILDARDPNFLQQFYSRSRLHLISTLAQEMKDYINVLREDNDFKSSRLEEIDVKGEEGPNEPIFFHVDLDCFFVSVALRSRPDLIGKPVAITHSKGSANAPGMSEIASASYPARSLGLKNGMLVRDALKLCPSLICLPYSFDEYREVSKTIYTIVARYCKEIKAVSCDEMYINFTRTCREKPISDILKLAEHIRADVRRETNCSASVGIGPTVLIARLASRYAKPDGVRWVHQNDVVSFIAKEKISNLPGIGHAMMAKLAEVFGELELCRDLQGISETELTGLFGKKVGNQIYKLCRGEDSSEKDFLESTVRKSVSCDINYGIRFTKKEEVDKFLGVLGAELEKKLDACKMVAGSLTLKLMVRSANAPVETAKYLGHGMCDTSSKSVLFKIPTKDQNLLTQEAIKLMNQMHPTVEDLRGIGLQCGRLKSEKGPSNTEMDMRSFFRVRRAPQQQPKNIEPLVSSKIRKSKFGGIVERDIPIANAKPVLFGETDSFQIRQVLKEMLLYEPTESVVFAIVDYLYELMASGYLDNLLSIAKFLNRMVYGNDCHEGWFFAICYIFHKIDNALSIEHGCRMLIPALNEYTNL